MGCKSVRTQAAGDVGRYEGVGATGSPGIVVVQLVHVLASAGDITATRVDENQQQEKIRGP